MSESLILESTFRGPLAPGYYDIVKLTLHKRVNQLSPRFDRARQTPATPRE